MFRRWTIEIDGKRTQRVSRVEFETLAKCKLAAVLNTSPPPNGSSSVTTTNRRQSVFGAERFQSGTGENGFRLRSFSDAAARRTGGLLIFYVWAYSHSKHLNYAT